MHDPGIINIFLIMVQDCWDLYGIDWNGPVSTDGDHTVIVPEFDAALTTPEVAETLQQRLERVVGSEIVQYIVAREVVRSLLV